MCGIAGFITANSDHKISQTALGSMAEALHHRGPDSHGIWVSPENRVGFAHTRLAIQDLSPAGHQPMESSSRRYVITFNGEIYNFLKIKSELEKENVQFRGKSDTEVLLAGIEQWGLTNTLQKTEGMFAFALWDKKAGVLHLARDRVGEKPLYIAVANKTIAFASQLCAITKLPFAPKEVCTEAVRQFLTFGYIPAPYAIYKNTFKVTPGTFLSIPYEKLSIITGQDLTYSGICEHFQSTCYWNIREIAKTNSQQQNPDADNNLDTLKQLLEETIQDQMISDVPYGAFLSGGIDSSLVVSVMQSISQKPINTFTIGFENKQFNEATHAKQISKHLGTEHHELYVSDKELLDVIPKLSTIYDEPFADSSQIPTSIVCSMARKYVTVALSGDGGDELFGGYNRYRMLELWKLKQRIPKFAHRLAVNPALAIYKQLSGESANQLLRRFNKNQGAQTNTAAIISKVEHIMKNDSFKEAYRYMLSLTDNVDRYLVEPPQNTATDPLPTTGGLDNFQSMLLWDQKLYLPDDNLVKVDRASMATSLETRHPLLNHRVIEHSWAIPQEQKMTKSDNKLILKKLLGHYLPTEMIERPKMGFSVPVKDWLIGPLREWASDILNADNILCQDVIKSDVTNTTWENLLNTTTQNNAQFIWRLVMLQDWLKNKSS